MFCPKCGHENTGDSSFCGWCGGRLTGVAPIRPFPADDLPRTAPSRPYRPKVRSVVSHRQTGRSRPSLAEPGRRTPRGTPPRQGAVIGLLLVLVLVVVGAIVANSSSKRRSTPTPTPQVNYDYQPPRDYSTYGQYPSGPYAGGQQQDPFGATRVPTSPTPSPYAPYTPPAPRRPLIPGQAQPTDSNYLTGGVRTVPTPRPSNPQPGGSYGRPSGGYSPGGSYGRPSGGYSPGGGYGGTSGGYSPGGSPYTGSSGGSNSSSNP